MSSIIPVTTALALLVHSLLGCCWHHAHAVGEECDHDAQAIAQPSGRPSGEFVADLTAEDADHHAAQHQHGRHHKQPCDEPDCSYIGAAGPELMGGGWQVQYAEPAIVFSGERALVIGHHALSTEIHPLRVDTAGLRAVLQVWLI